MPYQPVKVKRERFQLKTQGIARKSFKDRVPVRLAGREPILLFSKTSIQVALL